MVGSIVLIKNEREHLVRVDRNLKALNCLNFQGIKFSREFGDVTIVVNMIVRYNLPLINAPKLDPRT